MFLSKNSSCSEKVYFFLLSALLGFPIIDYLLRNVLPIPLISSVWDDLLIVSGLFLVGLRLLFGNPRQKSRLNGAIFTIILIGLAYVVLDITSLGINFEGFRAVFQFMLVFFIAFYLSGRPEHTKTLLSFAVIIGSVMALHGIAQWVLNVPMPGRWVDTTETAIKTRAFSIVGSPNSLGSYMAMLIPIALGLSMQEKKWAGRLLWLAATALLATCLVVTYSRGAWLALAGAVAVIGILYDRRLLLAGLAVAILAAVFIPAVSHRITYLFSAEYLMKSSQSGRIARWFEAYDQMRNNPLFGAGLGHFGGAVAKRNFNTIYVDNYYMKTMAEMGLLGLTAFLWLLLRTLREGYHSLKSLASPGVKFMALGMFGALLAIIFHNAVENIFEIPYLNTYFWLITGLLLALPSDAAEAGGDFDG